MPVDNLTLGTFVQFALLIMICIIIQIAQLKQSRLVSLRHVRINIVLAASIDKGFFLFLFLDFLLTILVKFFTFFFVSHGILTHEELVSIPDSLTVLISIFVFGFLFNNHLALMCHDKLIYMRMRLLDLLWLLFNLFDEINAVKLTLFVDHVVSFESLDLTRFLELFECFYAKFELAVLDILCVPVRDFVELK